MARTARDLLIPSVPYRRLNKGFYGRVRLRLLSGDSSTARPFLINHPFFTFSSAPSGPDIESYCASVDSSHICQTYDNSLPLGEPDDLEELSISPQNPKPRYRVSKPHECMLATRPTI